MVKDLGCKTVYDIPEEMWAKNREVSSAASRGSHDSLTCLWKERGSPEETDSRMTL